MMDPTTVTNSTTGLPKNVFMYWHDGFEAAPEIVQVCVRQARKINQDWTFHLLDQQSIVDYLPDIPVLPDRWQELDNVKKTNVFRLLLLERYGGIWIDATVFCMKPFDDWLLENMSIGMLFFRDPGPDRILSSWFIASYPEQKVLRKFIDSYLTYWNSNKFRSIGHPTNPVMKLLARIFGRSRTLSQIWLMRLFTRWLRVSPYFSFHYLFYQLVREDPQVRAALEAMPYLSARECHVLIRHGLDSHVSPEIERELTSPTAPVFKLTWKKAPSEISDGTVMQRLIAISVDSVPQSVTRQNTPIADKYEGRNG